MRLLVLFGLLSVLILQLGHASSLPGIQRDPVIILADAHREIAMQDSVQWLKADHTRFSLGQLQLARATDFQSLSDASFMPSTSSYWLRFQVINPLDHDLSLALSLSDHTLLLEGAYRRIGGAWQRINNLKEAQRLAGRSAIVLNFQANTDQWLYLRVHSLQASHLQPRLQTLEQYSQSLSLSQVTLSIMLALLAFIALLHITAVRFHCHVRHILVVYLTLVGGIGGMAQLPLSSWPHWLDNVCNLSPWLLAVGLLLSSFSNQAYQNPFKHLRTSLLILALFLVTLLIFNTPAAIILSCSLLPCTFVLKQATRIDTSLSIGNFILLLYIAWQLAYLAWPNEVFALDTLGVVMATTTLIFFASMSMMLPYFRRPPKLEVSTTGKRNSLFLSHISHELRSPMNGVLGMSELLNETPLSHTQRDYVETIQNSGADILRMIDRISDYARITSGRLQLEESRVDLGKLLENTLLRFQHSANQKNIELVLDLAPSIPQHIMIDERRLHTLVDFLLEKAVVHTEHGEVELRIRWQSQQGQPHLLFAIRDTSDGMHKEELKALFLRTDNSTDEVPVSGIGMDLCKQLVKLMGGELYVESTPGLGSTFSFSTPFSLTAAAVDESNQQDLLQGLSMLIVDDNSTLRKVIQGYAKSWGMHADTTYGGKEALAMLRNQANLKTPYDIILIDQNMPIMDGFQLAKHIQQDPEVNHQLLKIMLTGQAISSQQQSVIQAGIHQVVDKPVSARALQQVLAQRIQQRNVMKSSYS
ncbi:MAG: response regulator [Bermanella sp.]